MLEFQKIVLQGVADSEELFRKELNKSLAWLNSQELTELRKWLKKTFWGKYKNVIEDVLYPSYN